LEQATLALLLPPHYVATPDISQEQAATPLPHKAREPLPSNANTSSAFEIKAPGIEIKAPLRRKRTSKRIPRIIRTIASVLTKEKVA